MESQSKSDQESGNEENKKSDKRDVIRDSGSIDLESREREIEPFSDADPWRASRISETVGETQSILDKIQAAAIGFEHLNDVELRRIYKDAEERARWRQTRQDGFDALLRLARRTPPRGQRIL